MGIEKTIEIKAIDKEKALKRALNILGVELTENEAVEIVEKVKPRKKFFGLFGTEPGTYEISIKTKEKREEVKEKKIFTPKTEKVEKNPKYEKQENFNNIALRCSDCSRSGSFGYAQKEQHIKAQFDLCRCK